MQAEDIGKCIDSIVQQFRSSDGERLKPSRSRSLYTMQVRTREGEGGCEWLDMSSAKSLRRWYEERRSQGEESKLIVNLVDIDCYADQVKEGEGKEM